MSSQDAFEGILRRETARTITPVEALLEMVNERAFPYEDGSLSDTGTSTLRLAFSALEALTLARRHGQGWQIRWPGTRWGQTGLEGTTGLSDAEFLRSIAQNDYMIDDGMLPTGRRLEQIAAKLEDK